ncbi:TPA: hypothetical protein R1733_001031, partial [Campylobacter lari]|nr:hypothetical protein [Campylobacter lari]
MSDTHQKLKNLSEYSLKEIASQYKMEFLNLNQTFDFEKYLHILPFSLIEQHDIFCFY